jgi:hypothetical protein
MAWFLLGFFLGIWIPAVAVGIVAAAVEAAHRSED